VLKKSILRKKIIIIDFLLFLFKFKKFFKLFDIEFEPKQYIIEKSKDLNNWLIKILDKGFNKITIVKNKRDRYINGFERISEKRALTKQIKKDKKISFFKTVKKSYRERFSKKLTVLEKIEVKRMKKQLHLEKQKEKKSRTIAERRKKAILDNKNRNREALLLPYQKLVRYGEVSFRIK